MLLEEPGSGGGILSPLASQGTRLVGRTMVGRRRTSHGERGWLVEASGEAYLGLAGDAGRLRSSVDADRGGQEKGEERGGNRDDE